MLDNVINKKEKTTCVFKNSAGSYLGLDNLQTTISFVSFILWHAKFKSKINISAFNDKNKLKDYVHYINNDDNLISDVFDYIESIVDNCNISNIIKYIDEFNEDEVINIICDDYASNSRFNLSTPLSLQDLAYKILERNKGRRVLDIGSYNGSFLVNYALKNKIKEYDYSGIEINHTAYLLSKIKLFCIGVPYRIIYKDVFEYDSFDKYDKIFCNAPFGVKLSRLVYNSSDNSNKVNLPFKKFLPSEKQISDDWLYLCKAIDLLRKDGVAVMVIPNGLLYKNTDLLMRKSLVDKGLIEAVIHLPGRLFNNTAIETSLLIISRGNSKIKFIDASKKYFTGKYTNTLNVDEIFDDYENCDSNSTLIVSYENLNSNYSFNMRNYNNSENIVINNPKKLCDVCSYIGRGYPITSNEIEKLSKKTDDQEKVYKIININNITDGEISSDLNEFYTTIDKYQKHILEDRDLIISSKGVLSKIAVVSIKENENYIANGNFTVVRTDKSVLNPYYLKIFLESEKGKATIDSIRSGSVLPSMNLSEFREIDVPVPSIDYQEEIVNAYNERKLRIKKLNEKILNENEELINFMNKNI